MLDFSNVVSEQERITDDLVLLAKVYTSGMQWLIVGVNEFVKRAANDDHYIERMQILGDKNLADYEAQLRKFKITTDGNICYADETYTKRDAMSNIIRLHIGILDNMIQHSFCNQEDIAEKFEAYINLLIEFMQLKNAGLKIVTHA